MSEHDQQQAQIAIEDLELTLEVYELESEQKLKKMQQLFVEKGSIDPAKMFYEERSSLQVKFQNIISDLLQFLVRQQVAATEKLRRTFLRILDGPMLLLFKVSRFQIFEIRFNGFDIELEPMEAIQELANSIYTNIDEYLNYCSKIKQTHKEAEAKKEGEDSPTKAMSNKELVSYDHFLKEASLSSLKDKIFILYSYLRKGAPILKKKFENTVKIVDIFNQIEGKLCANLLQNGDWKTLKELSVLNYEIYLMEGSFDVLCFYLRIPLKAGAEQVFKELELLGEKAKQNSNYDIFILVFVKHHKQIMEKIDAEGIDPIYQRYVQNILLSILDLWACRLCHYREFCSIFQTLFELYDSKQKILELCLKYKPKVEQQDIILLRTNFKLEIEDKHTELLSLMGKRSLEEINSFLNNLYHKTLYNIDFRNLAGLQGNSLETIVNLLTLLNGNSSYQQFFSVVEHSLKMWNHTVDFQHGYKFIKGQFSYPGSKQGQQGNDVENPKIRESLNIIRNFCVLEDLHKTGSKDYETLLKGNNDGAVSRILFEFVDYLFLGDNQNCQNLIKKQETQQMLLEVLAFLVRCGCSINTSTTVKEGQNQTERICFVFSQIMKKLTKPANKNRLKDAIKGIIRKQCENIHVTKSIEIFKNLSDPQQEKADQTTHQLVSMMLAGIVSPNQQILLFDLLDRNVDLLADRQLTNREAEFLKKETEIKDNKISLKNIGVLKLSQFELVTNPMQFQKVMDNVFFSLDSNSKRFVQYLTYLWTQSYTKNQSENFKFYSRCVLQLVSKYPIAIPLFCCTRIEGGEGTASKQGSYSLRCVQFACSMLSKSETAQILKRILNTNCLRYRNGASYIKEQINPMIFKQLVSLLNANAGKIASQQGQSLVRVCQLLAHAISNANLDNLRLDTIQKAIGKCSYLVANLSKIGTKAPSHANQLANSHFILLSMFFKKKEKDMRFQTDSLKYDEAIWREVRFHTPISDKKGSTDASNPNIVDHTIVSPYSVSRQYNAEEYKITKIPDSKTNNNVQQKKTPFETIRSQLSKSNAVDPKILQSQLHSNARSMSSHKVRDINLSNLKYNLKLLFGAENVKALQNKQHVRIVQGSRQNNQENSGNNSDDQRNSIVQYYLKELQIPAISQELVIEIISDLLICKDENKNYLYLWTNTQNFEELFINLMAIYQFIGAVTKAKKILQLPKAADKSVTGNICEQIASDPERTLVKILSILTSIGYSDIWCESFKSVSSKPCESLMKNLRQMAPQVELDVEECFLPILLKASLETQQLQNSLTNPLDEFLARLFETRGPSQTALMYKVGIDRYLLNIIMKSLSIQHLNQMSFLIHSNFNNLRLYTDQLHEGLKALNMASKNRSYNEFVQLSTSLKDFEDQQFLGPMKLFKENFAFWVRIEKQGYTFKRQEQIKLALQRLANVCRNSQGKNEFELKEQVSKLVEQFLLQIDKLQNNLANRVKSFYLVTKLRDLSYQNAVTISTLHSVLKQRQTRDKGQPFTSQQIIEAINKIELFTLLNTLMNELVQVDTNLSHLFEPDSPVNYNQIDAYIIDKSVTICSTRRFSHSMSKAFEKCDLQFDEVIQRCYDAMKLFFASKEGNEWILQNKQKIYPPFLVRSYIDDCGIAQEMIHKVKNHLVSLADKCQLVKIEINSKSQNLISDTLKALRSIPPQSFYKPSLINLTLDGKANSKLETLFPFIKNQLLKTETLQQCSKSSFLIFNKYKTSEATLEEIQALGYFVAYSIFNSISIDLPLHPSISAAISFNICSLQDLLTVDFAVWEQLKGVLAHGDSKDLNLTFSHNFPSLKTFEQERIELVDKGASKKVNNLNRQQYVDLVACHIMYKNCEKQLERLLRTVLSIVPKSYISCLKIKSILKLFYIGQNQQLLEGQIMKNLTEKVGLVQPEFLISKSGQKIDNLKDYQNVHWFCEILLSEENRKTIRQKLWPEETNLFVITTIGQKGNVEVDGQVVIINHFGSKQEMAAALKKL